MFELYLVTSGGLYGHFGRGSTEEEAVSRWKKAGGKKKEGNYRVQKFTSDKPFAPADRDANADEADAWIGSDGSTNWIRSEREILCK